MHTQAHKHTQKASPLLLRGPPPQKLRNVVLVSLDAHCFSFTHTDGPSSDRGFIQRCYYSWLTQKLSEKKEGLKLEFVQLNKCVAAYRKSLMWEVKKIEVPVWFVSLFAYFKPQSSEKTAQLVRVASSHVNIFNIFRLGTKSHSSHYSWGWKTESKQPVPSYGPQTRALTVKGHGSNLKTWLS